ncbi:unnamed protein product [Prorocentrum cordatum]|uniref:Subtilisin n=1 Tax=Prorocentrum cordatum TaxID=2364126 RepID=A0ABN9SLB4_9DINO|nr:unnamed protein product [Polarella glacialis]
MSRPPLPNKKHGENNGLFVEGERRYCYGQYLKKYGSSMTTVSTILKPRISSPSAPTARTSIIERILMMSVVILVATMFIRVVPIMSSEDGCAMPGATELPMAIIHNYEATQALHQVVNEQAS